MQRSSEPIGTIAAALAKAHGQLVNPEKSLVGTTKPCVPGGTSYFDERTTWRGHSRKLSIVA